MIAETHTGRGKKRGREKSRESDTACQTKKGRTKEEEAQEFSLKKTVESKSKSKQCGGNTIMCPLYRGCELIVAKSGEIKFWERSEERKEESGLGR